MECGSIKAINHSSVHKICSGQVVLTLATAVKELVENSIDSGATIVEVKLKEYGSKLIEVVDNGKGVKPCDFQNLTLKHHTSKIQDFSDVSFVSTFGFRGEALSSLCALSNLEIISCHSESPVGSLLTFDQEGKLVKTTTVPRQVGTTVILKKIFFTLPVRHKEFLRNIKREYQKMINLLTAYCLISINKRITCSNITDKGKKTVVLSTNNANDLKDNILCIFGSQQVKSLLELIQQEPSPSVLEEYFLNTSMAEKSKLFRLEGYISSSIHGEGRSSTDRQFFFINGRPCDLPKVSKLINEVYHSFNKNQYPFVVINIILTEGSADVNVTPDKRQVFIPEEKLLLATIKSTLLDLYENQPSKMKSFSSNNSVNTKLVFTTPSPPSSISQNEEDSDLSLKRSSSRFDNENDENPISQPCKSQRRDSFELENVDFQTKSSCSSAISADVNNYGAELGNESPTKRNSPMKMANLSNQSVGNINFTLTLPFRNDKLLQKKSPKKVSSGLKALAQFAHKKSPAESLPNLASRPRNSTCHLNAKASNLFTKFSLNKEKLESCEATKLSHNFLISTVSNKAVGVKNHFLEIDEKEDFEITKDTVVQNEVCDGDQTLTDELEPMTDEPVSKHRTYRRIQFDMTSLKRELETFGSKCSDFLICNYRKFRSKIDPNENESAEEELMKQISKEHFSRMDIIGQFNLGFIITRLNDDLFIIDQHATDEKYNFETLQKETVLETQKLLNPQSLNLTAASEAILLEHMHIFEKNGFRFTFSDESSVGNKIQLISAPVSQNWQFGKEDVDELIFMLTDNTAQMVRPSRVKQMFASRACRKSVMIGTSLTQSNMKKLVLHMGEIEQPWNCPHGRPTIRHLFNLNLLR